MAADNEERLLSALIRSGDLHECTDRGVRPEWFDMPTFRTIYEFLIAHNHKYGVMPSPTTVRDNFPSIRLLRTTDPLLYFVDQLVAYRRAEVVRTGVVEASKKLAEPESAIEKLVEVSTELRQFSPTPVYQTDLTQGVDDRFSQYLSRKANDSPMLGMTSGYPTIDAATLGFQPEQLIVLVASSKSGKSSYCLRMCQHIHETYNLTPLFVSFEMSRRELAERHDATRAGVPLDRFRTGTLTSTEEDSLANMYDEMEVKAPFVLADASEGTTIDSIQARVRDVQPSLLVVDGVYMMQDQITGESNTAPALTNLTRGLKRLAQSLKIPVIISTQALRSKMVRGRIGADSAGWSSSFSQDADVLLGLEEVPDSPDERVLRVVMSRNSSPTEVICDFSYERSEFGEQ